MARQEGVSASLLFQWRKLERQDALTSVSVGEAVVPASELAAACAEIAKLQRVLGKKTLDNEILKEVALRDARTMLAQLPAADAALFFPGSGTARHTSATASSIPLKNGRRGAKDRHLRPFYQASYVLGNAFKARASTAFEFCAHF